LPEEGVGTGGARRRLPMIQYRRLAEALGDLNSADLSR
jgi:hypothetical protein